jgi:hypothetical protein
MNATAAVMIVFAWFIGGCSRSGDVTGGDETTRGGEQSETAADTSFYRGVLRFVVAYNDDTGNSATIQYGSTTRKVLRGASLMGWSYSEDKGVTWKYGGKLSPPRGWAVLWGDPAIVTSRTNYGLMFMSNLAFPDAKFPADGVEGYVYTAVGGACIARSTDGGVHFEIFQCVTNTDPIPGLPNSTKGHFYDGGYMAAGPQGEIYVAFVDVDNSQVDIWLSPDGRQQFSRLPAPFPFDYTGAHPRIAVGPDGTLFVMAAVKANVQDQHSPYMLVANRYRNGQWGSRVGVTFPVEIEVMPGVEMGSSVLGAPLTIRIGPQFSFAIGTSSADRDDSIRFLATQRNEQRWFFVRGGVCDYNLKSCGWYEGWTFGSAHVTRESQRVDVFDPNVTSFTMFGIEPRWQGAFLTRYGNSTTTVQLTRATLGYVNGSPFSIPVDIASNVPVCSDTRGYWSDYDAFLPVESQTDSVRFMRFMTDSGSCVNRSLFLGQQQHVRAVDYSY